MDTSRWPAASGVGIQISGARSVPVDGKVNGGGP